MIRIPTYLQAPPKRRAGTFEQNYSRTRFSIALLIALILALLAAIAFLALRDHYQKGGSGAPSSFISPLRSFPVVQIVEIKRATPSPTPTPSGYLLCSQ